MKEFEENKYCKNERDFIEYLTLKNFCRVLKKRKLYQIFRTSIGSIGRNTSTLNSVSRLYLSFAHKFVNLNTCGLFSTSKTIDDVYEFMRKGEHLIKPKPNSDEETKIQYRIVNALNQLLHETMESPLLRNIKLLSEIGDETFNMTCTELFGENFEDKTLPPEIDENQIDLLTNEILDGNVNIIVPDDQDVSKIIAELQRQMDTLFQIQNINLN